MLFLSHGEAFLDFKPLSAENVSLVLFMVDLYRHLPFVDLNV